MGRTSLTRIEYKAFHLFCGLGGGAKGFRRAEARLGNLRAVFRNIGGIDIDPASIADFGRLAGVPGTVLDLFDREQFEAFHGRAPSADWRTAGPDDIRRASGGEFPDVIFLSAPCKGFSGLLSETLSKSDRYQALNALTLRGMWLALEAFKDDPPSFILFENVPRIASRGRPLLDRITGLLAHFGYAFAETTHDCGELGNLAQSRKRFLLVARHLKKVPPFLYEPPKRGLRAVGEILDRLPLPATPDALAAGPMHRMPALQWKTWVRLAFVEAGSDWRSLQKLRVADGVLRDFAIAPDAQYHAGVLGITPWVEPAATVTSTGLPSNGKFAVADPRGFSKNGADFHGLKVNRWGETPGAVTTQRSPGSSAQSVADPRIDGHPKSVQLGVRRWDQTAAVVKGDVSVGTGPYAVSDPRLGEGPRGPHFNNVFRVVRWADTGPAVTAGHGPSSGGNAVADPRVGYNPNSHRNKLATIGWGQASRTVTGGTQVQGGALSVADPRGVDRHVNGKYRVSGYAEPAGTVLAASTTGNGAFAVADPRAPGDVAGREHYRTAGHYGVVPWDEASGAVTAAGQHDNGRGNVADPRCEEIRPSSMGENLNTIPSGAAVDPDALPSADTRLVAVIRALDGTWHRPFTTLELAALQSLVDPEEHLELEGLSDSAWRERIGNAVPPAAAEAIAGVIAQALLAAHTGSTFLLSNEPIWVQPIAVALSVDPGRAPPP